MLDIGCGFGLFSLYYAATAPARFVRGVDLNARRIAMARRAASRLAVENVAYEEGDARTFKGDGEVAAVYMLDIVHHIPPDTVAPLLRTLHACLSPGRRPDREGRRHASGAETMVHVDARQADGADDTGEVLERRRARRGASGGGVRRAASRHA